MSKLSPSGADTTPAPIDTSGIDRIIGYRLRRAQAYVFQEFRNHFDRLGLSPAAYSTLVIINANPGRKPSELAAALGIQRANFVPLVADLESRHLVTRRKSASDRRSFSLHLTDQGVALMIKAVEVQEAFEAKCIAELGGEVARDSLVDLLGRISD